ncbi:MAG: hypothetical protein IJV35_08795 [Neisseriaceae bacterium]|nr:hypothetical protein [Neisseriaceae bacterium]
MQFIGLPRRDFITARNDTVFNILKLFDYIMPSRLPHIALHARIFKITLRFYFQAA